MAASGGLDALARMPACNIQVIFILRKGNRRLKKNYDGIDKNR
tara:strand:+ start:390 stop:518 length:129 start_codon:yes stop_codon:yes gene_type:complete